MREEFARYLGEVVILMGKQGGEQSHLLSACQLYDLDQLTSRTAQSSPAESRLYPV